MAQIELSDALIIGRFDDQRSELLQNIFGDEMSGGTPRFHRLALRLYEYHSQGRTMYKTEAIRLIPVEHNVSAVKYLEVAHNRGWVEFCADTIDRRKVQVQPTETFLRMTRLYLSELSRLILVADAALPKKKDPP